MNTVITLIIAFVVIVLHVWLCHRSPKFWYLGGIIPLLWIGVLVFLFFNGKINFFQVGKEVLHPK